MTDDAKPDHRVLVGPGGAEFEAADGETVFAAALRAGVSWPTRCHGKASCRQCFLYVPDGSTNLSVPGRLEVDALKRVVAQPLAGHVLRLACQARVVGDVAVERVGVRPATRSGSEAASTGSDSATR